MKKLWLAFGLLVFAGACSDKQEEQNPENLPLEEVLEEGEQVVVRPNFDIKFEEETYTYKFGESQAGCDKGSDVVCAIDLYAKCTLDPKGSECDKKKCRSSFSWTMKVCSARPRCVLKSSKLSRLTPT